MNKVKIIGYIEGKLPQILQTVADNQHLMRAANDFEKKFFLNSIDVFLKDSIWSFEDLVLKWQKFSPNPEMLPNEKYLDYVFDEIFKSYFSHHLEAALYFSKNAQKIPELKILLQNELKIDEKDIEDRVFQALIECNLIIYLNKEVNASVLQNPNKRSIFISNGLADAIEFNSKLCTYYSTLETDNTVYTVRHHVNTHMMMDSLNIFSEFVKAFREGNYGLKAKISLRPGQKVISAALFKGGIFSVLFHEYTHIILSTVLNMTLTKKQEEQICDYVSAEMLMSIGNNKMAIGGLLVFYLISIYDTTIASFGKEPDFKNYPTTSQRLSNYHHLLEKLLNSQFGVGTRINKFDFIPVKWIEMTFFQNHVKGIILERMKARFEKNINDLVFPSDIIGEVAETLLHFCFSLPAIGEDIPFHTLIRKEDGRLIQKVLFNFQQFIYFFDMQEVARGIMYSDLTLTKFVLDIIEILEGRPMEDKEHYQELIIQFAFKKGHIDKSMLHKPELDSMKKVKACIPWLLNKNFFAERGEQYILGNIRAINLEIEIN